MDCPHCTRAANALWHGFDEACKGCRARSVSRSQPCHFSRRARRRESPYLALVADAKIEHEDVKHAETVDAIRRPR